MIHNLKIRKRFYWDICTHKKRFEIRKNDRDFKVGDVLRLNVIDAEPGTNPPKLECKVDYILYHEDFPDGIMPGYCVMSISIL